MAHTISAFIARNVRAERARRDWKQSDLAEQLGVSANTISMMESGTRTITADYLPRLCRAFGIPLVKLVEGAEPDDLQALGL